MTVLVLTKPVCHHCSGATKFKPFNIINHSSSKYGDRYSFRAATFYQYLSIRNSKQEHFPNIISPKLDKCMWWNKIFQNVQNR